MDGIYERAQRIKSDKIVARKEVTDRLNYTEQQLIMVTQEMKEKIHQMVEDVEQRVRLVGFVRHREELEAALDSLTRPDVTSIFI